MYDLVSYLDPYFSNTDNIIWCSKKNILQENFDNFWDIIEKSYDRASNYADFNAYVVSSIVNEIWGYDTLFCSGDRSLINL